MSSLIELACPPIRRDVRIALIGCGDRGQKTLARYAFVDGAEWVCLVDVEAARTAEAQKVLARTQQTTAEEFVGTDAWRRVCLRSDIDLVYICTDWAHHAEMACYALQCGRHVAVEVPAATTVEECYSLIEAARRAERHLFMTENCFYDLFALCTGDMVEQGLFGEVVHYEGAYIHRLAGHHSPARRWMAEACARHGGNAYPTHAMASLGRLFSLHRGDRLESVTALTAALPQLSDNSLDGKVSSALLRTHLGRTILLQLDVSTPRPYSRLQTLCGTRAFSQKYPIPTLSFAQGDNCAPEVLTGEEAMQRALSYSSSPALRMWQAGKEKGVPNEMNYAMDTRLIYCLQHGLPLDIDAYDAAEWSCLAELTARSAQCGGAPVAVPDFTNGAWRTPRRFTMYE